MCQPPICLNFTLARIKNLTGCVIESLIVRRTKQERHILASLNFFPFLIPKQCIYIGVRLTNGTARIFSYHLMPWPGFQPTSAELLGPDTFRRALHRLSFRAAAELSALVTAQNQHRHSQQRKFTRAMMPTT